jgi:hypothetical protein
MNIKKLYGYLLFSGLMAQAFTPVGSLAFRVQSNQMMLFGVSEHFADIYASFAQVGAQYFPDDNGNVLCFSGNNPITPFVGNIGAFGKSNIYYIFKVMGPGTALIPKGFEYRRIRGDVVNKFLQNDKMAIYQNFVTESIFSYMGINPNQSLIKFKIDLGGNYTHYSHISRYFNFAIENFAKELRNLENKNKQAMDFNTLYYRIRKCFIEWLYNMAKAVGNYEGVNKYLELGKSIIDNGNLNRMDMKNTAIIAEFWSDPANAVICEFWEATMAWFLDVFEKRGVRSANGEPLIEFAIAELQWLLYCVDLFLRDDHASGQADCHAMNNVTTRGCIVQLKNYCYLLYHYKEKICRALKLSNMDMGENDRLRQIKASLNNLCKQWDGRTLRSVVSKLFTANMNDVGEFKNLLNFLCDEDRINAQNIENDLHHLRYFVNFALADNTRAYGDDVKKSMQLILYYIDDMLQVLSHIYVYSEWIKNSENTNSYCNRFRNNSNQQHSPSRFLLNQVQGQVYNPQGQGQPQQGSGYNQQGPNPQNQLGNPSIYVQQSPGYNPQGHVQPQQGSGYNQQGHVQSQQSPGYNPQGHVQSQQWSGYNQQGPNPQNQLGNPPIYVQQGSGYNQQGPNPQNQLGNPRVYVQQGSGYNP